VYLNSGFELPFELPPFFLVDWLAMLNFPLPPPLLSLVGVEELLPVIVAIILPMSVRGRSGATTPENRV